MTDLQTIHRAVEDLAFLRRVVTQTSGNGSTEQERRHALSAGFVVHAIGFSLMLALLVVEFATRHAITTDLMSTAMSPEVQLQGVLVLAFALAVLSACLYFIVWRASRHSQQDLQRFLARNFGYLRGLSFLSSLFVKLVALSLVIFAQRPEWTAPLLCLFIGDELIQGRYFYLRVRLSLVCGVLCILAAFAMFLAQLKLLVFPLGIFLLMNGLSLLALNQDRKVLSRGIPEVAS
jgi:hypothetical protein